MAEPLCKNKFYNHVCQVILLSSYFNKHTKLQELRNTVDGMLQVQSKTALDDDTWRACMKILNDKGLGLTIPAGKYEVNVSGSCCKIQCDIVLTYCC